MLSYISICGLTLGEIIAGEWKQEVIGENLLSSCGKLSAAKQRFLILWQEIILDKPRSTTTFTTIPLRWTVRISSGISSAQLGQYGGSRIVSVWKMICP